MNDNENILQEKDLLNDERISRFLQGKMKADEEATFMEEMKNNDDLRDQAIVQARLVKGMKQVDEELKDAFRQADEQTIKRIAKKASESSLNRKSSTRWLAIAASMVFIVFVGFKSYDYYDTTSLGKEYANTFPTKSIIRGESSAEVETELATLFDNVAKCNDLDNTTSRLATLWELSKQETYNDYTDYAPYIGWNLAIGYLENYEKAKAKDVLMEMEQAYSKDSAMGSVIMKVLEAI